MLRFKAEQMAQDIRQQKEIAEQANLAKSTFLAAASHDLRQPIHALGLFVGALRGIPMPSEGKRLVEQIEASTDAMDGLFSALLDISRLDAGIVEVHRRPFAIAPFVSRICRDHEQEAHAKGLTLTCRPGHAIVFSDPLLMERVLRNLISNAIKFVAPGVEPAVKKYEDEKMREEGAKRLGKGLIAALTASAGAIGWGLHEFIGYIRH
jgi:signal transduction histidine kinase